MNRKDLEKLTKEQLIEKCLNQNKEIKRLSIKADKLTLENLDLTLAVDKEYPQYTKIRIYLEETLSFMEDVERLKYLELENEEGE